LPRENCPAFANAVAFPQGSSRHAAVLNEDGLFFHKFISLMPDEPLERKRKGSSKIGMQCGKLTTITDSRISKRPKWKRRINFRAIASAVRDSAVCLHRSFAA